MPFQRLANVLLQQVEFFEANEALPSYSNMPRAQIEETKNCVRLMRRR